MVFNLHQLTFIGICLTLASNSHTAAVAVAVVAATKCEVKPMILIQNNNFCSSVQMKRVSIYITYCWYFFLGNPFQSIIIEINFPNCVQEGDRERAQECVWDVRIVSFAQFKWNSWLAMKPMIKHIDWIAMYEREKESWYR